MSAFNTFHKLRLVSRQAHSFPAFPCRSSESVSGVFPEFFRNFFRKVPAVLGVWPRECLRSALCESSEHSQIEGPTLGEVQLLLNSGESNLAAVKWQHCERCEKKCENGRPKKKSETDSPKGAKTSEKVRKWSETSQNRQTKMRKRSGCVLLIVF